MTSRQKVTTPFGSTSDEYEVNVNRTAVHYVNGFTTTYDYDLLNRLICEKTIDTYGDIVVQYSYTLDIADEIVWVNNFETGETELKDVLNVWVKETDEILPVSTSDGETIDTRVIALTNILNKS